MSAWIDVRKKSPKQEKKDRKIVVLVNEKPFICTVISSPSGFIYLNYENFYYSNENGFHGDPRFAKPTHWMELPESPNPEPV